MCHYDWIHLRFLNASNFGVGCSIVSYQEMSQAHNTGRYIAVCISMHWEHISQVGIPHKCARSDICADHNQSNLDNTSATLVQLFTSTYLPTYFNTIKHF